MGVYDGRKMDGQRQGLVANNIYPDGFPGTQTFMLVSGFIDTLANKAAHMAFARVPLGFVSIPRSASPGISVAGDYYAKFILWHIIDRKRQKRKRSRW